MSLNRVTLVGRMVKDAELRTTTNGKAVAEFTLAVDKRFKPANDGEPTADFFRVKAWNQQAEFVSNYGGKGRLCAVDGRLESREYNTKEGERRIIVEVVADNVQLLDRPREEGGGSDVTTPSGGNAQRPGSGYSRPAQQPSGGGSRGGNQPARGNVPSADEYDPFGPD